MDSGARGATTNRRHELVELAAQVFAEKGIAHTTVRDIAELAGILSGSLYHHFDSKDQIVAEVLADGLREAGQRDAAIVAAAIDPADAMRQLIIAFVIWVGHETRVARILLHDQQYLKETTALADVEAARQANRVLWTDVVTDGIERGLFRQDLNADVVVRAIFDGTLAAVRWLPPVGSSNPRDIGEELARFYVPGLLAPAADAGTVR